MAIIEGGLEIQFPHMVKVKQNLTSCKLPAVADVLRKQLSETQIRRRIRPGMSVAVGVGSRGITNLLTLVKTTVEKLREYGANPFIVPAMGSHGEADPEGQRQILEAYGITEESLGVPVLSSLDVVELARTPDGVPVYSDRLAFCADGVVPVNRVKFHTHFRGEVESGLLKMLVIGFGKHKGATAVHACGFHNFHRLIPEIGAIILEKVPVLFGVASIEDAFDQTAEVAVIEPGQFLTQEKRMLRRAKEIMARLRISPIDLLIVDEIGKDISGAGFDPNIVDRFPGKGGNDLVTPTIHKVLVLSLTEKTHGNACGLGYADITVRSVVEKINRAATYTNAVTAASPEEDIDAAKIPLFLDTDREAVALGIRLTNRTDPEKARVVRIKNTLQLEEIMISESLIGEAVASNCQIISPLIGMRFDSQGKIEPFL